MKSIASVVTALLLLLSMGSGSSGAVSPAFAVSSGTAKVVRASSAPKYDARYCIGTVPTLAEVQLLGIRALARCAAPQR